MQLITTKTGSTYRLRAGLWSKNYDPYWEKVWWAYCIHDEDFAKWANHEEVEHLEIQVGKKLYIGSRDMWWMSTTIVSIEEIPDEELE
jgi:hypothetical protein